MNEMRENTCCFTGHRKIPLAEREKIAARLEEVIAQLYGRGITNFIAGGALGFDTMAAEAVLRLRREERYDKMKLILALPCTSQTQRWTTANVARYAEIMREADEILYTSQEYTRGCMHKRNRYMVDNSSVCVCYLTKNKGGTAYTVGYAEKCGLEVVRLASPEAEEIA